MPHPDQPPDAFNYHVVDDIAHRPWPMPRTPWIMTQSWQNLLFAHWRVDPDRLARRIPPPLQLDLFEGEAWVGVVPFRMEHVTPRGVPPLPWLSAFPEVNVRTYVRCGDKPGVFFFSLDATNPVAVRAARVVFHLPYYQASIEVEPDEAGGVRRYESHRRSGGADLIAAYHPIGPVFHGVEGTREHFLTERYCLYAVNRRQQVHICEIHHARWPLQIAAATFEVNTLLEGLIEPAMDPLTPPLLHVAARQDTINWRPTRLDHPDRP